MANTGKAKRWAKAGPVILVILVLLFGPTASVRASIPRSQPARAYPTAGVVAATDGTTTVVVTAVAVTVLAVTAVATTSTDIVVATELTVFTEVAARTTGELGEPVPVSPVKGARATAADRATIAHSEFDH